MKAKDFKPSRLEMMTDRTPRETNWLWLVNFIKSDALKNNTEVYRKRLAELEAATTDKERKALKDQLMEIKRRTGGFFPHAVLRGGRTEEYVVEVSNHIMVDLDKIPDEQFADVRRRLIECPYVFLLYTTYSGRGLRAIVRVDGEYTVRQFRRVWTYVNDRIEEVCGVKADRQCGDITRFSGLAHDAEVYYNADAALVSSEQCVVSSDQCVVSSDQCVVSSEQCVVSSDHPAVCRGIEAKPTTHYSLLATHYSFDDLVERIRRMVEANGCYYVEGHHNEYIANCMYLMNKFGVAESEALAWGLREFSDYNASSVRSTVRSCYRKTAEHGILSMTNVDCGMTNYRPAGVDDWKNDELSKHKSTLNHSTSAAGELTQNSKLKTQNSLCYNVTNVTRKNFSTHTRTNNNVDDIEVELPQPPTFPPYEWPRLLQQAMDCGGGDAQRDLILIGAVTVLGASLSPYVRFLYGKRWMFPSLQVLGVAPPASGKGVLTWVRRLIEPIHERMLAQYKKAMENYLKEKNVFDCAGRAKNDMKQPEQPQMRMFLIAGNNSATGVLENLMDANGIGLICESEADTVSTAIGTDYGHWSDTLRKAFDHDRIAYNRRANKEYREVGALRLSVLLSGTPAQVQPLITSAENGLFSRQLFYSLPASTEWQSQFSEGSGDDVDSLFKSWGKDWSKLIDSLSKSVTSLTFSLSAQQRKEFDKVFSEYFASASVTQDGMMKSWVTRLAINLMRTMSVVAFLRLLDDCWGGDIDITKIKGIAPAKDIAKENVKDGTYTRYEYAISDDDFHAVMSLARPLYLHASYALSLLPKTEAVRHKVTAADALLVELGNEFTHEEAQEVGKRLGLTEGTVRTRLSRMVKDGILANPERSKYVLARACEEKKSM